MNRLCRAVHLPIHRLTKAFPEPISTSTRSCPRSQSTASASIRPTSNRLSSGNSASSHQAIHDRTGHAVYVPVASVGDEEHELNCARNDATVAFICSRAFGSVYSSTACRGMRVTRYEPNAGELLVVPTGARCFNRRYTFTRRMLALTVGDSLE